MTVHASISFLFPNTIPGVNASQGRRFLCEVPFTSHHVPVVEFQFPMGISVSCDQSQDGVGSRSRTGVSIADGN